MVNQTQCLAFILCVRRETTHFLKADHPHQPAPHKTPTPFKNSMKLRHLPNVHKRLAADIPQQPTPPPGSSRLATDPPDANSKPPPPDRSWPRWPTRIMAPARPISPNANSSAPASFAFGPPKKKRQAQNPRPHDKQSSEPSGAFDARCVQRKLDCTNPASTADANPAK